MEELMQKRKMGKTEEWVSLLGFGCMRFPQKDGKTDMSQVLDMVDYAKGQGVNYFDTAYVYGDGESERSMGEALRRYPRDSYFVADKLPLWIVKEEADLEKLFNTSLERIGTDYIDFYLIHALCKDRIDLVKKYHVIEFLKKKRAQGKIKYIGFSFHDTPEVFSEIVEMFDWDFVQIQLNYVDWQDQRANELYDIITKKNLPCVVMEPIRGGALANPQKAAVDIFKKANPHRSSAAWALDFCASHPAVKVILSGMSDMAQIEDNVETLSNFTPMTKEEYKAIDDVVAFLNSQPHVGCTGCRYCMPCPKGVDIPACFSAYNGYMKLHDKRNLYYMLEIELKNKGPEICVKCGACVKKCPQHLDIPNELLKVAELRKELN
jgi:predicted aldo/keto reductase-like oxidoreductase